LVQKRCLKHDPEKWTPVFGKDHAQKREPHEAYNSLEPA
jgi:hypothetical protein